jgi:hypothetical protein
MLELEKNEFRRRKMANGNNKFQWSRVDELLMFGMALAFVLGLLALGAPIEAVMTAAGSLMTVVPVYVKAALERNGNGNGNGNGNTYTPELPTEVPSGPPPTPPPVPRVDSPKESESLKHFLRMEE